MLCNRPTYRLLEKPAHPVYQGPLAVNRASFAPRRPKVNVQCAASAPFVDGWATPRVAYVAASRNGLSGERLMLCAPVGMPVRLSDFWLVG